MKKAFSLLEIVLVLVIFTILLSISSKSFESFYKNNFKNINESDDFLSLNLILLHTEKLFQNCVNLSIKANGFSCFLVDSENMLRLREGKFSIQSSLLSLENNNTIYALNADFTTLLELHQALFSNKLDKLYFWQNDTLIAGKVLSKTRIENLPKGAFLPLLARLEMKLDNKVLSYELYPNFTDNSLSQKAILSSEIDKFELDFDNKLELCLKKMCLKKSLTQDFLGQI